MFLVVLIYSLMLLFIPRRFKGILVLFLVVLISIALCYCLSHRGSRVFWSCSWSCSSIVFPMEVQGDFFSFLVMLIYSFMLLSIAQTFLMIFVSFPSTVIYCLMLLSFPQRFVVIFVSFLVVLIHGFMLLSIAWRFMVIFLSFLAMLVYSLMAERKGHCWIYLPFFYDC